MPNPAVRVPGSEEDEPITQNARAAMGRLLGYARRHLWAFLLVVGLVIIYNLTQVVQPWLVKIVIDQDLIVRHPVLSGIVKIGLIYLAITIVGLISNFFQNRRLQYTGQVIIRQVRIDLFRHIESLSMRFFDTHETGRLITNVSSDTNRISLFFTNFLLSVIRDGFALLLVMGAMLLLNWKLALLSFLVIPVIVIVSVLFRNKLRDSYGFTRSQLSRLIGYTAENLAGMRITQLFHQEQKQLNQYTALNQTYTEGNVTEFRWAVLFNRSFDALGNFSVALMIWIGGMAVLHHAIELGVLYAFVSYIQQFFGPINSLTQQWNTLQSSMISAERIGGVLLTETEIKEPSDPVEIPLAPDGSFGPQITGEVVFDHVWFRYSPEQWTLKDVGFTIPPRSFVGFVGETGAGKSTLMSLLTRFYDVTEGAIRIDGIDLRRFRQQDLHRLIAIVQQEVNLFSGTVMDNIRLFRSDIPERAVEEAARLSGAHQFIRHLPGAYESWITAKGTNLSLGQRQLLAFARALTLNPRILILDEATASLDSHTEMVLQEGLTRIAEGRTTLVIAHRLSTIRDADQIYVMDHGAIVEAGTHRSLVQQNGHYAELVRKSSPSAASRAAGGSLA